MSAHEHVTATGYIVTFVMLLVLATVSLFLSFLHLSHWGLVVALAIAVVKAVLVLFYFMHLAEQRFTNRLTMLLGAFFVALLVGLTATDVATRHTFPDRPMPPASEAFYRH